MIIKNPVDELTHDDIAAIAAKKLKSMGYIAYFANVTSGAGGEQPDAFGVKSNSETFLVEAKVSRADFLSDKNKVWRQDGVKALGHYRAYITPKGLLDASDIPYGWQLWEVHGKTKPIIKIIKGQISKKGDYGWSYTDYLNMNKEEYRYFCDKTCINSALGLMATILNRMDADGINIQEFASRNGKGFLKN